MIVQLPYGKENLELSIPDRHFLQTLLPNEVQTDLVGTEEVIRALEHPIGTERLKDPVSPGQKVAIVTSDITRPLPLYLVLPPVLKELNRGGISDSDITIVFALGSHRAHTREEMIHLVGEEVFNRVKCADSKDDFVHMGTTSRGTPVDIYRDVAEADVRICLGNIEVSLFCGIQRRLQGHYAGRIHPERHPVQSLPHGAGRGKRQALSRAIPSAKILTRYVNVLFYYLYCKCNSG